MNPGDPAGWEVLRREYLFEKPWLRIRQDWVRLPSGAEIREYYVSEFPPWVNVVAVTPRDEVVLVRQYRHGLADVHYELPAGVVDPDDHGPEAAARRELSEETGYGGGRWSSLLTLSANPGLTDNLTHCFLAEGVELEGPSRLEATEDLRVHLVPLGEVARIIDAGDMVQALMVAPLLRYLRGRGA